MKVYIDVFSQDELFSDSYPMKLINDLYYEVEGKVISISNDIDEALIGGNKATGGGGGEGEESEPVEDEGVESSSVTGINIVLTHKLYETSYDKNGFKEWLKEYMKKLKERVESDSPSRVEHFQKGMQEFAKFALKNFDNFRFYVGEKMDYEAMVVLGGYRDDQTPYFIFFKDGVREEKY